MIKLLYTNSHNYKSIDCSNILFEQDLQDKLRIINDKNISTKFIHNGNKV